MSSVAESVASGAELLDERLPGWAKRVNLDRLRMNSLSDCVLGQLYDSYFEGAQALGIYTVEDEKRYGFYPGDDNWEDEADKAWRAEIARRL